MKRVAISLLCLSLFSACGLFNNKDENNLADKQEKPLARVFDKYLYYKDIEGLQGQNYSKEDSTLLVQKYINTWILKQLELVKAEAQVDESMEEIQSKIRECRNTLLIHEFEKGYLEKKLDTSVSEKDIKNYYEENFENFQLKQNIIKGFLIKVPIDAPKIDKARTLIKSDKEKDIQELRSFCLSFASHFVLEDTTWMNFDELVKNTPFAEISDKADFLEKNQYSETSDKSYLYFLRIQDYKVSKQISPFEFVKEQIQNTLINKKRIELINQLKLNIYEDARKNKEFEIFSEK